MCDCGIFGKPCMFLVEKDGVKAFQYILDFLFLVLTGYSLSKTIPDTNLQQRQGQKYKIFATLLLSVPIQVKMC